MDNKPAILVTGGTGFIGTPLVLRLQQYYQVWVLLHRSRPSLNIDGIHYIDSLSAIPDDAVFQGVINLAGAPLAAKRWNKARKQEFVDSRVNTTRALCELLERLDSKPDYFISGSAIGFYGPQQDEELTESSDGVDCFSHDLCSAWEAEADRVSSLGVRLCIIRIGVVLGSHGGALAEMKKSNQFGFGTQLGDGKQWLSWIHLRDILGAIDYLMQQDSLSGVVNLTAPNPVDNHSFTRVLAQHTNAWLTLPMPGPALKLLVGEMAQELLLSGQRVLPSRLLEHGYQFAYPDLDSALQDLLGCKDNS